MKTNKKVLAGALALALGLGAVVPSFAESEKLSEEIRKELTYSAAAAASEIYANFGEENVKLYNDVAKANKLVEEKEAELEKALTAEKAAEDALDDFVDHADKLIARIKTELTNVDDEQAGADASVGKSEEAEEKENNRDPKGAAEKLAKAVKAFNDYTKANVKVEEATADYDYVAAYKAEKPYKDLLNKLGLARQASTIVGTELSEAKEAQKVAKEKFDKSAEDLSVAAAYKWLINEAEGKAVPSETTKGTTTTAETKKDQAAKLQASLDDLKAQKYALKKLEELVPDIIAKHQAKYDEIAAKLDERVKVTEDALKSVGTKTSFLFSTAYASEEGSVDVNEIINGNDAVIKESEDFMKGLNEEVKNEDEEKPSEEKPSEEKPAEEKPAEEKPADDNKATVKPAAKVKGNPKTGVASVAGVAAVLAAASAAYVDSKRK